MENRIFLIACVAQKGASSAPAADLYLSPWFTKAKALAIRSGAPWFILSAQHGLVSPSSVIAPYDLTLATMKAPSRRAWAEIVIAQMRDQLPPADEVVLLAGDRYRAGLMDWLAAHYGTISIPMRGMPIGRQLQWLTKETA